MLEKLTIGQLATIFNINIQTLYYYDKIGLLKPAYRNSITNIRTYSFKQVQQLSTILYLKKCGFNLDEIKEIEQNLTPKVTRDKLLAKSEDTMKQWREIIKLDTALHKKLDYIDEELNNMIKDKGEVLYRKKRYYLTIGEEEDAYGTDSLYYHPVVVKYCSQGKIFGILIDKKDDIEFNNNQKFTIPNGNYLVEYHKGPYTTIFDHQDKIIKNHPDLNFTGDIYTFDIVSETNCSNIEEFITKMEFQITN